MYLLRVVYVCDRVVTYELSTFVQLKHLVAIYVGRRGVGISLVVNVRTFVLNLAVTYVTVYIRSKHRLKLPICHHVKNVNTA